MRKTIEATGKTGAAYHKELETGTQKLREYTQEQLKGVDAAEAVAIATLKKSLALKDEEQSYSNMASRLKGMSKLHAEVNEEMKKYERSADYVKLLKVDVNAASIALERHQKVTEEAVYSLENLIQAYRETQSISKGFIAGLQLLVKLAIQQLKL